MPEGCSIDIHVFFSKDGTNWIQTGPYRNPQGERLQGEGLPKLRLQIKLNAGQNFISPKLLSVTIHRYDQIIEFGGEAGWT